MTKIDFDISFTPWTIDTYSTFTGDSEEDHILENLNEDRKKPLEWDEVDWDFRHSEFVQALAENWCDMLSENIIDDVIKKVELVGKAYSPREYNFSTDNCETVFTVDMKALEKYVEEHKEHYRENRIHSYDGFMCFMEEPARMLHYYLHHVSEKEYSEESYMYDVYDNVPAYEYINYEVIEK